MIKGTLISTSFGFSEYSKSCCYSFYPLSYIRVAFLVEPHATAMFHVIIPLSFICLTVRPEVLALPLHLVLHVFALINATICKYLMSMPLALIHSPLPVISLSIVIQHYSFSFPPILYVLSVIDSFFVFFETKVLSWMEGLHVDGRRVEGLKKAE